MSTPGPSSAPAAGAPTAGSSSSGPAIKANAIASSKGGPRSRHQANMKKYGTPLPILLPPSSSTSGGPDQRRYGPNGSTSTSTSTSASGPATNTNEVTPREGGAESSRIHPESPLSTLSTYLQNFTSSLNILGSSDLNASANVNAKARSLIEVPRCTGVYDPITRSVWVLDRQDAEILFRRGFFGKGTLSRSEPSWRERRMGLLKGGDVLLAEQVREKRRLERKKFKVERAAAMLDAAKTAEAILVTGQAPVSKAAGLGNEEEGEDDLAEVEVGGIEEALDDATSIAPPSPAPSSATAASTVVDLSTLNAQTFLVRPTRPDANRNRGKKAFKRKPPAPPAQAQASNQNQAQQDASTQAGSQSRPRGEKDVLAGLGGDAAPSLPSPFVISAATAITEVDDEATRLEEAEARAEAEEDQRLIEELVEEMEHLQLSLEEAWFLSTALGVLRIYDPVTQNVLQPQHVLPLLLTPLSPSLDASLSTPLLPDDPFLVSYVAYHHFRTIGWVVKPGIKFCADWLLYRRGPVFSHSAFAVVVVPVYGDENEQSTSPYGNTDWYEERTSWKWMNTIMRVNSLVQKTVILAYVTIPSLASFTASRRDGAGLDVTKNDMESLLKRFSVREVALQARIRQCLGYRAIAIRNEGWTIADDQTRFGPARRRD